MDEVIKIVKEIRVVLAVSGISFFIVTSCLFYVLNCIIKQTKKDVIRCKDCKYCREAHYEKEGEPPYIKLKCTNKYGMCTYRVNPEGYCHNAELKGGDGDG